MDNILDIIYIIGPEFEDADEDIVNSWITLMKPFVSKEVFGDMYNLAVAYLVCHKMKLAGYGDNSIGGIDVSVNTSMAVSSISEGGSSISFQQSGMANGAENSDAEYSLTRYGSEYLQIRKMRVIPITISH